MRRQVVLILIGCAAIVLSAGCRGLPPMVGKPAGGPLGDAPPPALRGEPPAGVPAPEAAGPPAAPAAPIPEPPSAPEPASAAPTGPTEAQYKEAVLPLLRRLRDNGLESVRLPPIASCREVGEPRRRLSALRAELDDIEHELSALEYPSSLERPHLDLTWSVAAQRAAHDLQLEALDHCASPSAVADRLQRASSRLLEARGYWEAARRRLNLSP